MIHLATLLAALFLIPNSSYAASSQREVVRTYARHTHTQYAAALEGAYQLQSAIENFLNSPSQKGLEVAKSVWTEARKAYSQTEVFRFYGGPIDAEDGPEGALNAWPLDEVYIDSIISDANLYPTLDATTLLALNEKDGEKNISTGYHAIEYLLWGQDLSKTGPGERSFTDFTTAPDAERRKVYLRTVTELLVHDLETLQLAWAHDADYVREFLKDEKSALAKILTGAVKLAGSELSQERMFVAVDTGEQEEEHSCFSDTTHFDILYNFIGVRNVLSGDSGVLSLLRATDPGLATEISENLALTDVAIRNIPAPFDQAITTEEGKALIMDAIVQLETLAESLKQAAVVLEVQIL